MTSNKVRLGALRAAEFNSVEYGLAPMASAGLGGPSPDAPRQARALAEQGDLLHRRGEFSPAADCFGRAVRLQPLQSEYHYKLACSAWRAGSLQHVESHLLQSVALDPNCLVGHAALAQWFLQLGNVERALMHSGIALERQPNCEDYAITRALILAADRQPPAAWALLEPLVRSGTPSTRLALAYAQVAPRIGHEQQAIDFIERVLLRSNLAPGDQPTLHFAASSLLDRVGRYVEAFEQAKLGNELGRRPYDPRAQSLWTAHSISFYTKRRLRSLPRATHGSRRPVFIVGMPRSGTSLVEQILASHPAVHGAGELELLSKVIRSAESAEWSQGLPHPECFDAMSLRQANELAAKYLHGIDAINSTASFVTDKMPLNFLYLDAVELLLPEARVIHCMRDPRDTCLSCYLTDFNAGQEFSFDLSHLASFYRDYRRLMAHWKKVLRVPILDVRYEDVVADAPGQTRRLLDFLGLPWDERCLAFHENARHVPTASREQVRQPIYASSVGRWKHYAAELGEVLTLEQ